MRPLSYLGFVGLSLLLGVAVRWFDPGEALPAAVAAFARQHSALSDPDDRGTELWATETYLPADEPVAAVGTPSQGEPLGDVRLDDAPVDGLLGSHADPAASEHGAPEVVLVRGTVDEATRSLRRRVYWLGAAGVTLVLGGQLLAFVRSSASVAALLPT